jgi:hypothetical protein
MNHTMRPPYAFLISLLATLAAGCGSAARVGDRVSGVLGRRASSGPKPEEPCRGSDRSRAPSTRSARDYEVPRRGLRVA